MIDKNEEQLLAQIKEIEKESLSQSTIVDINSYIKLADLFHIQKKYTEEAAILLRYIHLRHADRENFIELFERIDRLEQLQKKLNSFPTFSTEPSVDSQEQKIIINTKPIIKPKNRGDKIEFNEKKLHVLTICALFTGREDCDEIFQLGLVLFEYNPKQDKKTRLIETFFASRQTKKTIPQKKLDKINLNRKVNDETIFDKKKIISLFQRADFVVSHNDADIERKLLSLLIPEISQTPWYSCQKDIPWGAFGYESKSLSKLCLAFNEKSPKNALERANAICKILQKQEPDLSQVFLERLYNAHPMKPFEWTPKLIKQHQRLTQGYRQQISIVLVILILATVTYFWFL